MADKKKNQPAKKRIASTEEAILTKEDFFKALDKAIQPVPPEKKQTVR